MPTLQPEEYDISYFDGRKATYRHNAGYSEYSRWHRHDGANSAGEFFKDQAAKWVAQFNFTGTLLDIGCAKGFHVQDLRELGVDAWGVDVSPYAIGEADPVVAPYLSVADIRTHIDTYANKQWDVIFSARFLGCLAESELPSIITGMNRKSKQQIHIIDEQPNPTFYIARPLSWWAQQGFAKGTRLVSHETNQVVVV